MKEAQKDELLEEEKWALGYVGRIFSVKTLA